MNRRSATTREKTHALHGKGGFSYVEVMVATLLIALALVPALESLHTAVAGARIHEELTAEYYHAANRMIELAGEPYADLDAEAQTVADPTVPTSYSDPVGAPMRRLVYLARYDGDGFPSDPDPFVGGDDGLLWIRVQVEGSAHDFQTLRAR